MSIKSDMNSSHPITQWSKTTVADGNYLQTKTISPIKERDDFLADKIENLAAITATKSELDNLKALIDGLNLRDNEALRQVSFMLKDPTPENLKTAYNTSDIALCVGKTANKLIFAKYEWQENSIDPDPDNKVISGAWSNWADELTVCGGKKYTNKLADACLCATDENNNTYLEIVEDNANRTRKGLLFPDPTPGNNLTPKLAYIDKNKNSGYLYIDPNTFDINEENQTLIAKSSGGGSNIPTDGEDGQILTMIHNDHVNTCVWKDNYKADVYNITEGDDRALYTESSTVCYYRKNQTNKYAKYVYNNILNINQADATDRDICKINWDVVDKSDGTNQVHFFRTDYLLYATNVANSENGTTQVYSEVTLDFRLTCNVNDTQNEIFHLLKIIPKSKPTGMDKDCWEAVDYDTWVNPDLINNYVKGTTIYPISTIVVAEKGNSETGIRDFVPCTIAIVNYDNETWANFTNYKSPYLSKVNTSFDSSNGVLTAWVDCSKYDYVVFDGSISFKMKTDSIKRIYSDYGVPNLN